MLENRATPTKTIGHNLSSWVSQPVGLSFFVWATLLGNYFQEIILNKKAMNNEMPIGEAQNSQATKWYKKWWVILIGIIIVLPFFWIVIPVGLIWLIATKGKNWSKKTRAFIGATLVIFLVILIVAITSEDKDKQVGQSPIEKTEPRTDVKKEQQAVEPTKTTENVQVTEAPKQLEVKIPKYEIVYEIKGKRYDGAVNYILLIDPVNTQNDSFKEDMKNIVRHMVKEKGQKISVDILDDKSTLELFNESHYGKGTLDRILTKAELEKVGLHLIASFSGQLATDIYPNALSFFPGNFKNNPKIGKYVETIEFNP